MTGYDRTELLRLGSTLRLDAVAAEVTAALRSNGVRAIVLRGPAIVRTLYRDGGYRAYDDVDLLVSSTHLSTARGALLGAGFEPAVEDDRSQPWVRDDGVTVDLHTSLVGVEAASDTLWAEAVRNVETDRIAGVDVDVPENAFIAFIVALHAAQHGERAGKARADLDRAASQLPIDVWRRAADIARRTHATAAFSAGLSLAEDGAEICHELDLDPGQSAEVALRAASAPPVAIGLQRLATARGIGGRARLVRDELAPAPAFMRSMYPVARRGRLGLAAAYALRPARLLWQLPRALHAWRHARRSAR